MSTVSFACGACLEVFLLESSKAEVALGLHAHRIEKHNRESIEVQMIGPTETASFVIEGGTLTEWQKLALARVDKDFPA